MEASFVVTVGLKEKLNTTQVAAFERGTAKWLEETELETGTLSDVRVKVDDQTIIETDIPFQNRRSLQGRAPTLTRKDLQLSYTVFANYIGTDISFDLADTLDPEFQEKNTLWLREIDNEDPVFGQLNPIVSGIEEMEQQKQMQSKGGAGTMVIVLVVAVAAVALGVAASVYSVRSYRVSAYGQELASPHSQSLAAVSSDGLAVEVIPQPTKSFCLEPESTMHANQGITPGGQGGTGEYSSGVFNQNSMERGCNPMEPIIKNLSGNGRENKQYMMSGQQSLDPPSAASDVGIGSKRDGQANTNKAYTSRAPPPLDPVSVSDGGSRSNYRKNAIFDAVSCIRELVSAISFLSVSYFC